jgi:hypothetical protein
MEIDSEIRAALIAYTVAHVAWKEEPDSAMVDQDDPAKGTTKAAAKRLRGQCHSRLLELGKLAMHQKEN